jgi:hypothetical protein
MQVACYAKKEGMGFVFVDLEDFFAGTCHR